MFEGGAAALQLRLFNRKTLRQQHAATVSTTLYATNYTMYTTITTVTATALLQGYTVFIKSFLDSVSPRILTSTV